jgi:hypothetical protein
MESTTFFPGANRRVTLGSPTKQCSNGRIVFAVQMPLTGESFASLPDWVGSGFEAVSKAFTEVNPEVQEVSDLALAFSNDAPKGELFAPPSARLPGASLKGFKIVRAGEPDDPEIELHFKAYGPFTRDFWAWIGEMAGQEVYMAFPSTVGGTVTVAKTAPALHDDPDDEADRLENLKPEHDDEFSGTLSDLSGDIPEDPSLEEDLGPEFESQVRQSMGAPEPFGDKPRLVDARPGRGGKSKDGVKSKPNGARKSLAVN